MYVCMYRDTDNVYLTYGVSQELVWVRLNLAQVVRR